MKELINQCESALRAGHGQHVALIIGALDLTKLRRDHRLAFANLCRRAGLLAQGLKLLTPIVHPGKTDMSPTSAELAEYAVLLERSGAVPEAIRILSKVSAQEVPEAYLFRAFCYFKSWDYAAAIPELHNFIAKAQTGYSRLVGEVNLSAAFVTTGDFEMARAQIDRTIAEATEQKALRLVGNCHELRAQISLLEADFGATERNLNDAMNSFGPETTSDLFFVKKWRCILNALENKELKPLNGLSAESQKRSEWETVREVDLFKLMIRHRRQDFNHLFFGTPFLSYRERIIKLLGRQPADDIYVFGNLKKGAPCFDLRTGEIQGQGSLNPGKKIHQLLSVMLRDLYRPQCIGGLFAELFPDEHFNIFSSPARVHQILYRLRLWFEESKIPVRIVQIDSWYRLEITGKFAFALPLEKAEFSGAGAKVPKVLELFAQAVSFSARDVRKALSLPTASCTRLLKWAVEHGHLIREGENNSTIYRVRKAA